LIRVGAKLYRTAVLQDRVGPCLLWVLLGDSLLAPSLYSPFHTEIPENTRIM